MSGLLFFFVDGSCAIMVLNEVSKEMNDIISLAYSLSGEKTFYEISNNHFNRIIGNCFGCKNAFKMNT